MSTKKTFRFIDLISNLLHVEYIIDNDFVDAKNFDEFKAIAEHMKDVSFYVDVCIKYKMTKHNAKSIHFIVNYSGYKFEDIDTVITFAYECAYSDKNGFICKKRDCSVRVGAKFYKLNEAVNAVVAYSLPEKVTI